MSNTHIYNCFDIDVALKYIEENQVDAIISDVDGPFFLGVQMMNSIVKMENDIPVLMLAGEDHGLFYSDLLTHKNIYLVYKQQERNRVLRDIRQLIEDNNKRRDALQVVA